MIAVIDYDAGNLFSVANALERLGIDYVFTADPAEIEKADGRGFSRRHGKAFFPGVGACFAKMRQRKALFGHLPWDAGAV